MRLFSQHPFIAVPLGVAFVLDLLSVFRGGIPGTDPGTSFFLDSVLVVTYFLGITSGIRALSGRPLHLGLVWPLTIALCFGWFYFQVGIGNERYHPSLLLMLCMVAAFKTLRLQEE